MKIFQIKFHLPIAYLKIASSFFLVLPIFLFLLFWVKTWIAIPVIGCLIYTLAYYYKLFSKNDTYYIIEFWQLILILFFSYVWVSHCGAGGFGIQFHDLSKIYAIVHDIAYKAKPVNYLIQNDLKFLSSYLGYHISVPLLLKSFGWNAILLGMFLMTYVGVLISLMWFFVLTESFTIFALLFFIFIGGFDFAGHLYLFGFEKGFHNLGNQPIQNFIFWDNSLDKSFQLMYHGNTNSLFWSPQHALPCWIASGFFYYETIKEKTLKNSPLYLFTLTFWSPMMMIGLFPYFLWNLNSKNFKSMLGIQNLLIIPSFLVILFFTNAVPVQELEKGFLFYKAPSKLLALKEVFAYAWFCMFEFLLWLGLAYLCINKQELKKLIIPLGIVLMLIPLYKLGKYNDWAQRVSLPSLFLMWVVLYSALKDVKSNLSKVFIVILTLLGSIDSYSFISKSMYLNSFISSQNPIPEKQVLEWPETSIKYGWPLEQSIAPKEAFFFKYLAK
jgi:hypothetical protein